MATPRKVSVAIQVGLGAGPVDVTNDIVTFTFEESIAIAGETIDLTGRHNGLLSLERA